MPIPDTLPRKITADFRAEKSMGAEKKFVMLCWPTKIVYANKSWLVVNSLIPDDLLVDNAEVS